VNKKNSLSNDLFQHSRKGALLEKEEEFDLILRWQNSQDDNALKKILDSYLRLVVSIARKYTNYGLSIDDLIHEGTLGIMYSLSKFDVSKGFRLSTYASWWIRASIQDYILKNWSVVKIGSTASQKSLFFNLKKIKKQISSVSSEYMGQKEINIVSKILNVKPLEIQNMESRLAQGDLFLNQTFDDESGNDLMSLLPDNSKNPEEITQNYKDGSLKSKWLKKSINTLTEREKTIIQSRKLKEKPMTLDQLGQKLGISKERVRQVETRALSKLKKIILEISNQEKEFFV
jgi:RNA polymerase sigma-32 factor|tara:strand:- start:622 stop:1485 length:864 start_codon:yes stop_codon:yes gene_type:complete